MSHAPRRSWADQLPMTIPSLRHHAPEDELATFNDLSKIGWPLLVCNTVPFLSHFIDGQQTIFRG